MSGGADIDARDKDGRSALIFASSSGFPVLVALLLEWGADVNAKDREQNTALDWAYAEYDANVIELLLKAQSLSKTDPDEAPIMGASAAHPVTISRWWTGPI